MQINEYQREAAEFMNHDQSTRMQLINMALGVTGEAGEVADHIKKIIFHQHPTDPLALANELGDVLWYVSSLAHELGFTLETIAQQNLAKLKKRYPDGFDPERSIHREE